MIYDVYVDLFFFINFSMDYICLYITAKILRHKISALRFVIASALGGAYSVASLFLSLGPFPSFLLDCAACFLLIVVCFYKKGTKKLRLFPAALLFVGVSMLLGGVMTAIFNLLNKLDLDLDILYSDGAHTYVFAIIAVVSAAISVKGISFITKKNRHREYYVKVTVNGITEEYSGFVDTGNMAREQISGKGIIFLDGEASASIIDPDAKEKYLKGEFIYRGSRLIPITTAAGSTLAFALIPDKITLKRKSHREQAEFEVDCFIALTDLTEVDHKAIIPEDIILR